MPRKFVYFIPLWVHFPPLYTSSVALLNTFCKKIRKGYSMWGKHMIKYIAPYERNSYYPLGNRSNTSFLQFCRSSPSSAAVSLTRCHCGQFRSLGVSTSGRHSAQRPPFAEGILNPLLISPPVRPIRCRDAWGFAGCLRVTWGWLPRLLTELGLLCLSGFLLYSANFPGNGIPVGRATSGCA